MFVIKKKNEMATRPIFIPAIGGSRSLVLVRQIDFQWHPGFAVTQKRKSIESLHDAVRKTGAVAHPLEISSKSPEALGRELSAFSLTFHKSGWPKCQVEQAFQSSKVFRHGGPFADIIYMVPRDAKRDRRLKESGDLVAFDFDGGRWPLEPRTLFYDWIYINAVSQNPSLADGLVAFDGFTDIEFNPEKSINCQARSAALYVALTRAGLLDGVLSSPERYRGTFSQNCTDDWQKPIQKSLL